MAGKIYWLGTPPFFCQGCDCDIGTVFFDMKTNKGQWAMLCTTCAFHTIGIGKLGTGLGQKYEQQADGRFLKVEG